MVLTRRQEVADQARLLLLPLKADERTCLRGHRRTACGRSVLLQLPRQGPLKSGEYLVPENGSMLVRVQAADEAQLLVTAESPLDLLKAAYHLGNRHVALELHPDSLRLLDDSVLATMLCSRGLNVRRILEPFEPEFGAYGKTEYHNH